ncbi:CoA pyrophosphatase [Paenibacillus sp. BSR1-1]|uniref:NUDIX hydrolase n=1 Tax=Paenibacillus sp. BSR1-1 TaxID=3020845 RepID=UPI0025B1371A|nr:CoA pyrophosphatase [Paenibacillus sp. BSR1-1]MDN3018750.1 CoA pyrophosphatase [Paenibacillus sp. BSR1-1]
MNRETILTKLKDHVPTILGSEKFSRYAVMLPLIQKENGIHVLFEIRSQQLRRQPGEICFPGGRIDSVDFDEKAAAIRETKEELGIAEENISEVFPLNFMVSPFGMMVFPFAGFITNPGSIQANPSEVGELFTVPLSFFIEKDPEIYRIEFKAEPEENFPFDLIIGGENYNWRTRGMEEYFYIYEDKVIWGLTARILAHFIEMIR